MQQREKNDSGRVDFDTHTESPHAIPGRGRLIPTIGDIARSERLLSRCEPVDLNIARQISERRQQTEGYVYFVQCGEYVKIGYTSDPMSRMSKFKTNNPYECRLLAMINGGKVREAELQERFSAFRHRGEWYVCSEVLMAFIASLSEPLRVSV